MNAVRAFLQAVRRELGVAVRTYLGAWFGLALALWTYGVIADHPKIDGVAEWLGHHAVLYVVCLFYMFWPAVIATGARVAYRLIGRGAFVPLPLMALGCAGALWLGAGWLQALLRDVFAALLNVGACGAHTNSIVIGLFCLAAALASPAGIWATVKLLLAIVLLLVLGSLPGIALALFVIARAIARGIARHRTDAAAA